MNQAPLPKIIQGGMGAGVSGWRLAKAVAEQGQLGVISGTALDTILVRRLQMGDLDGSVRRALDALPLAGVSERILERFYVEGGKADDQTFAMAPRCAAMPSQASAELLVAANFVEVFLAKEGHDGQVGVNYLEKLQLPTLPSIYGAMLAGVSWVLMGAGIPKAIPGVLDTFADGGGAEIRLDVHGAERGEEFISRFNPSDFFDGDLPRLDRPRFAAIVSSTSLAGMLAKRASGRIDAFIVEHSTAGGHNAPPRGAMKLTDDGQPIYGERDLPNLDAIRDLGRPFWLAGSYGRRERLQEAIDVGAQGVQVGTAFAYCEESGMRTDLKQQVLTAIQDGGVSVFTDPFASPTGFPFKVVQLPGTLSDDSSDGCRERACDLAYLRHAFRLDNGKVGWRCPAEPIADYLHKGGEEKDTEGRVCLCNALMATCGMPQVMPDGQLELPLVTSGMDVSAIKDLIAAGRESYTAADVIAYLLGDE